MNFCKMKTELKTEMKSRTCEMCIATEIKSSPYNGINFFSGKFPIRISAQLINAIEVKISGITWLIVHDTPEKKESRRIIIKLYLRYNFSPTTIRTNSKSK